MRLGHLDDMAEPNKLIRDKRSPGQPFDETAELLLAERLATTCVRVRSNSSRQLSVYVCFGQVQ